MFEEYIFNLTLVERALFKSNESILFANNSDIYFHLIK